MVNGFCARRLSCMGPVGLVVSRRRSSSQIRFLHMATSGQFWALHALFQPRRRQSARLDNLGRIRALRAQII
jgi:hypothetical protein